MQEHAGNAGTSKSPNFSLDTEEEKPQSNHERSASGGWLYDGDHPSTTPLPPMWCNPVELRLLAIFL